MKHVIIGTAGHIDHGKSTLIEALTGTHPDRLEEEKRRGITIDLGFAFLDAENIRMGFVDVPGHERFVRNMLAGVGGIDIVLLVVAADESIKPQTREHFDICRLLGVKGGLIALTKCDLVDADMLELVRLEIEDYVAGSFLQGTSIVPVSARSGAGMDRLKQELLAATKSVSDRESNRFFRLPIDRAFAMKGFGTVVTGTLISGTIRSDEEVELFPARRSLRVRGLHSGGKSTRVATAGQRTAVNLAGIEVDEIQRGMVLASPGRFQATDRIDARVTLLPAARPLKNRARVHFHQGTAEMIAEIILFEGTTLAPGGSALAQFKLDRKVLVLPSDRFIVRQFSPLVTIGGGVVIDALASRHRPREYASIVVFLSTLEKGNREEILPALLTAAKTSLSLPEIVARTGWTESEVRETAESLRTRSTIRIVEQQPFAIAATEIVSACVQAIRSEVEKFHAANPLLPGIAKEDLRGRIACASAAIFQAALADLVGTKSIQISEDIVRLAGRQIALQPEEAKAKAQIEREFERAGLAVPRPVEVLANLRIDPERGRKILQILLREKLLIKVTEDLVFHKKALEHLRETLAQYRKQHGERLPLAVFKELTGVSRKYAIPLLEYLDRERVTRRVGDERVIL